MAQEPAHLFLPITSNYKFCSHDILPAFGVFDSYKNPDFPRAIEDYKRHLEKCCLAPEMRHHYRINCYQP